MRGTKRGLNTYAMKNETYAPLYMCTDHIPAKGITKWSLLVTKLETNMQEKKIRTWRRPQQLHLMHLGLEIHWFKEAIECPHVVYVYCLVYTPNETENLVDSAANVYFMLKSVEFCTST